MRCGQTVLVITLIIIRFDQRGVGALLLGKMKRGFDFAVPGFLQKGSERNFSFKCNFAFNCSTFSMRSNEPFPCGLKTFVEIFPSSVNFSNESS